MRTGPHTQVEIKGTWPISRTTKIAMVTLFCFLCSVIYFSIWFVCELVSLLVGK
jgi:hypothetical protein